MQYGKVEICGVNTSKIKVIPEQRKLELLRLARGGDNAARNELIEGNLRLVLSSIQRFSNRGENPDDLFQVGCIGLIKAIDNFDLTLDVRFSTYAVPMIIGEIRRYLRDNNAVRVSRSMRDTAYRAMQSKEKLIASLQREPTIEEIASDMNVQREDVVFALESIVEPVSLYEPVYSDGGDTIYVMDQLGDGGDSDWIDELCIRESISALGEREKKILSLRFIAGMTQIEVANEIGISQAQVSRLEKSALDRIRNGETR
ncbi:MAG: RNA polymerase sporulation sigma factor SigG [Clostridia bacterium]|nr:RNA polymerase sporulation sigma factor SigG [Clostridia bacterium]